MADETTVEGEEVLIGTVEDDMPNPTIHRLTLPSITVTIRGGRTELSPGWPLDQILEIEQVQREQMERNQRRKEYLK